MGSGFVLGFIQAMDGEKDPRNLVIAFSTVHRILLHLEFGEWKKSLLESVRVHCALYMCVACVCVECTLALGENSPLHRLL